MATTSEDTIMEEREELMVSPKLTQYHHPTRKIAQFLKPSVTANSIDVKPYPFNHPKASSFTEISPLKVSFNGWRIPPRKWKAWVDRMHSLHQSTWKKAGIEQAVLNSSYEIPQKEDLILGFAQKWCDETNTFLFVWGEATITLEDMMVLGGYSVLGESILTPLETLEQETTLAKLNEAKKELAKSTIKKVHQLGWLNKFKDSGSEIEHEAFLVLWLSRFVFPSSYSTVVQNVYPIAVHLARGLRMALAPAVLATIYRDLSLLKAKLIDSDNSMTNDETSIIVWAPLQLVQIWIWERFEKLRPKVSDTDAFNPRFARWEKKKLNLHMDNSGSFLDCDLEDFCRRPYTNHDLGNRVKGRWVDLGDCLDEEMESWGWCLRVSELVGIQGNCIEQYLPHRVAMQFGMDQDIPGDVPRNNATPESAWRFYTRLLTNVKVYLPSPLSEPLATARYLEWRNKSTGMQSLFSRNGDDETKTSVKDESRTERSKDYVGGEKNSERAPVAKGLMHRDLTLNPES